MATGVEERLGTVTTGVEDRLGDEVVCCKTVVGGWATGDAVEVCT
ncbi:MAG TPA: hypothetical protein VIJ15_09190 [Dermatophilaceae bacterium]